ncbi:hypothetical protein [Streptomyces griseofuscus]|uniref:hypothetical protein n=1 Tax=Streptomyces griseofuscus TaxID=146922 RepID=UPI0033FB3C7B
MDPHPPASRCAHRRCRAASQTRTGTVCEWERWTGLVFPASGEYVVPRGLGLRRVDKDSGQGAYVEPGVWMRHM